MTEDPAGEDGWPVRREAGLVAVAALLLVGAAVIPAMVVARPANQIPVETGATDAYADPTAGAWEDVPGVGVPLASAPSGLPGATDTSTESLRVQTARSDERLYVRVTWADATADRNTTGPRDFADAVAVQVPVDERATPPIAMGGSRNMVNVWYWTPGTTEELLAGGAGTTTEYRNASVSAQATHTGEEWQVVFARDLTVSGANRTDVEFRNDLSVAFAAWNGSAGERSGVKAVSEWYHYPFGPGPQGPPYEAILWLVAGLSIAVVVAVTAAAVRRSDEARRGGEAGGD